MPRWDGSAESLRKAIRWSLVDAFLWTGKKDTGGRVVAPPGDFERRGAYIVFRPAEFADRVAELLIQRGFGIEGYVEDEREEKNNNDGVVPVDSGQV